MKYTVQKYQHSIGQCAWRITFEIPIKNKATREELELSSPNFHIVAKEIVEAGTLLAPLDLFLSEEHKDNSVEFWCRTIEDNRPSDAIIESAYHLLSTEVSKIDDRFSNLDSTMQRLFPRILHAPERLDALHQNVQRNSEKLEHLFQSKPDEIEKLAQLKTDLNTHEKAILQIRQSITEIVGDNEFLTLSNLADLLNRVGLLENRVGEIEIAEERKIIAQKRAAKYNSKTMSA